MNSYPLSSLKVPSGSTPIVLQKLVKRCHVALPDTLEPVSAIVFEQQFYAYVRFFPTSEAAQRGATRMVERGNRVVLTRIPKGLVLWVWVPDALLIPSSAKSTKKSD
ncbi:MAG: hypothetical protein HC881_10785 [Leptolyngbyaceae cyanobacterium SL_7_1]|nr:hypothetical protein [Leptolyngbyaceae cyanobacterium SL_7_1]